MKIFPRKTALIILRTLVTLAAIIYLMVFVEEGTPPFSEPLFGVIMVYVLFFIFVVGYIYLWKNEKTSGIILVAWYCLLLITAFFIWTNGGMTIVMGFPVAILGVLLIIYSYVGKLRKKPKKKP